MNRITLLMVILILAGCATEPHNSSARIPAAINEYQGTVTHSTASDLPGTQSADATKEDCKFEIVSSSADLARGANCFAYAVSSSFGANEIILKSFKNVKDKFCDPKRAESAWLAADAEFPKAHFILYSLDLNLDGTPVKFSKLANFVFSSSMKSCETLAK